MVAKGRQNQEIDQCRNQILTVIAKNTEREIKGKNVFVTEFVYSHFFHVNREFWFANTMQGNLDQATIVWSKKVNNIKYLFIMYF